MTHRTHAAGVALIALTLLAPAFAPISAQAGVLHKHPKAAGLAAGLAAHHMAKKSAAKGGHSLAARHPVATGVVAGAATHHILKKH